MQTWYAPYRQALIAWCSLILVLGVGTGRAAMRQFPMEDLARKADAIVLGTVLQQESAWDAQHTAIHTDVTVAVEQVLAGTPGNIVTLRVAGGIVDGIGMRTSNDASFQKGERVIVFLDTTAIPSSIVGMQQGKFTVKDDLVTQGDETVRLEEFIATVRGLIP